MVSLILILFINQLLWIHAFPHQWLDQTKTEFICRGKRHILFFTSFQNNSFVSHHLLEWLLRCLLCLVASRGHSLMLPGLGGKQNPGRWEHFPGEEMEMPPLSTPAKVRSGGGRSHRRWTVTSPRGGNVRSLARSTFQKAKSLKIMGARSLAVV